MTIALWVVGGVLVLFALTAFTGAPYVPSHRRDIQRVFREGVKLTKDDVVLDIGAGDGVVLIDSTKLTLQEVVEKVIGLVPAQLRTPDPA